MTYAQRFQEIARSVCAHECAAREIAGGIVLTINNGNESINTAIPTAQIESSSDMDQLFRVKAKYAAYTLDHEASHAGV